MRISVHRLLTHRAVVAATFAATLVFLVLAFTAPGALASPGQTAPDRPAGIDVSGNGDEIVRAGGDVVVRAGETVDSVTVFGGDAIIAGTVRRSVVAVGGDVILRGTARVGTLMKPEDATVFAIGGTTRTAPGAIVTGTTGAWEDLTGGEALVAAAVAMTGLVVAGTIVAVLVVGLLALGTLAGAALLAAFIWLIVWLVRRDGRSTPTTDPTATMYGDGQTYAPQAGDTATTAVAPAATA